MSKRIVGTVEIELDAIRPDPTSQTYVNGRRLSEEERRSGLVAAVIDAELQGLRRSLLLEAMAEICIDSALEEAP